MLISVDPIIHFGGIFSQGIIQYVERVVGKKMFITDL